MSYLVKNNIAVTNVCVKKKKSFQKSLWNVVMNYWFNFDMQSHLILV